MARTVNREVRRAEIVSAALSVFAERGVANATVSDIVKAAGMAQGTFYLYFESKDDVILAVAVSVGDTMVDGIEKAVETPGASAVEKLLALRDVFGGRAAPPGTLEVAAALHSDENRPIHDRLSEHLTPRLVTLVERIVEQGVAEGVFDVPDVHAAAWFVLGGLQSAELSGVPFAEMPAALATITEFALRALGHTGRLP